MKKNELVETKTTEVVVTAEVNMNDWGGVSIESKDLVLPKILIQQSMSEAVKQKTAEEGDLVNTLTNENMGKEIELIPFYKTESIIIEKWNGRKFEFYTIAPYEGKQRPFEEEIEGVRYKNSHQYSVYCLTDATSMPHVISFKGTSNKIGRQLTTMMYVANPAEKLPPPGKAIKFSAKTEISKAGDQYQVSNFAPSRRTTPEEIQACLKWVKILKDSNIVTAEEEVSKSLETTRF